MNKKDSETFRVASRMWLADDGDIPIIGGVVTFKGFSTMTLIVEDDKPSICTVDLRVLFLKHEKDRWIDEDISQCGKYEPISILRA